MRTNKEIYLQFKRNKKELLDPDGDVSKRDLLKLNVKYETEGRFEIGCIKIRKLNNKEHENSPHTVVAVPPSII